MASRKLLTFRRLHYLCTIMISILLRVWSVCSQDLCRPLCTPRHISSHHTVASSCACYSRQKADQHPQPSGYASELLLGQSSRWLATEYIPPVIAPTPTSCNCCTAAAIVTATTIWQIAPAILLYPQPSSDPFPTCFPLHNNGLSVPHIKKIQEGAHQGRRSIVRR
jgi:hypothetical protein